VRALIGKRAIFGEINEAVLVQERIRGTEYIVNTVSSNGFHRMTTMLRYKKKATAEGGNIYDVIEGLTSIEPGMHDLVGYALKVADAIGIRYGAIHGEYMIDEKGPVLIEVNCRPMGMSMPEEYLDLAFGQHETDTILDAYLEPDKFRRDALKPYRPKRKMALKLFMVPNDMDVENHPLWLIAKQLRSTYKVATAGENDRQFYRKTNDLDSAGGCIYLIHDSEDVVNSDIRLLQLIERDYFQLLFSEGTSRKWFVPGDEAPIDFKDLIRRHGACGSILVAKDDADWIEGTQTVTADMLDDAHKGFDYCIVGYRRSLVDRSESDLLRLLFATMDKVREGGRVIIPGSVSKYLSYGKKGAEMLLTIKGLTIEAPSAETGADVVGIA
ncbi:MAG: hypothetical protein IJ863_07390, partial [Spirochaetales bacterium]|nr:hypothetical protein [Spirochaetales bacterium]